MYDFLTSYGVCRHNLNHVSSNHDFRTPWIIKMRVRVEINRKKKTIFKPEPCIFLRS